MALRNCTKASRQPCLVSVSRRRISTKKDIDVKAYQRWLSSCFGVAWLVVAVGTCSFLNAQAPLNVAAGHGAASHSKVFWESIDFRRTCNR